MPFHQLWYVQYMHHGLTFVFLCVPVLYGDNSRCQFVVAQYGFSVAMMIAITLIARIFCSDAETLLVLFFICSIV